MRLAARADLLLAVLFSTAAPSSAGGASCVVPGRLPDFEQTWIDVAPDASADPEVPGYAIVMELESQPDGGKGHGLFVRLSAPGEDPLFRRERRAWAMVVQLQMGELAIEYAYADRTRSGDLWTYDPAERRVRRAATATIEHRDPIYTVCETVRAAELARGIRVTAATVGRVMVNGRLRRALQPMRYGCR